MILRLNSSTSCLVTCLVLQEGRVTGVQDEHLAQHAADDDLDVLVVDLHTLQAVNLLHGVDQVLLHLVHTPRWTGCPWG